MKNTRLIPLWATAILMLLAIGSVAFNIIGIMNNGNNNNSVLAIITYAAFIAASLFFIFYIASGFGKQSAGFFKAALAFFTAAELATVLFFVDGGKNAENEIAKTLPPVLTIVMIACLVVLWCAKDLGRSNSLGLAYGTLVASVGLTAYYLIANGFDISYGYLFGGIVLSVILCAMVAVKYKDKAARGRFDANGEEKQEKAPKAE